MKLTIIVLFFSLKVFAVTTEEQYQIDLAAKRTAVKLYINDADDVKNLKSLRILVSAMLNNAGSLENLTAIENALKAAFPP